MHLGPPSQLLELIEVEIEVPANPLQEYAVPFQRVWHRSRTLRI